MDCKQELRRLLARSPANSWLKYTDHVDTGMALFQRVCELDLEGIVAKQKFGPYVTEREQSTWFKILNREYSQMQGREDCLSVSDIRSLLRVGIRALSHQPFGSQILPVGQQIECE